MGKLLSSGDCGVQNSYRDIPFLAKREAPQEEDENRGQRKKQRTRAKDELS